MIPAAEVEYRVCPAVSDFELNNLFSACWPNHRVTEFQEVLRSSMAYICAYRVDKLVGYVNAAWDGKTHAFILDPTVHPEARRRGIGRGLVLAALEQARARGVTWVHVDFEPHLRSFYRKCGFRFSEAGVINVASDALPL
jgi:ribosomal protein S18 acetylase RimI-like enzyme